jgi:hypothetical protein
VRKRFDSTSKRAIHLVSGASVLTRLRIRFSAFVASCDAAQHLAADRVRSPIKGNRMSFALLATKCSDAIRLIIFLQESFFAAAKNENAARWSGVHIH